MTAEILEFAARVSAKALQDVHEEPKSPGYRGRPLNSSERADLLKKFQALLDWQHPATGPRDGLIEEVEETYQVFRRYYRRSGNGGAQ